MRLIIHPQVRRDVRGILDWYDARVARMGQELRAFTHGIHRPDGSSTTFRRIFIFRAFAGLGG